MTRSRTIIVITIFICCIRSHILWMHGWINIINVHFCADKLTCSLHECVKINRTWLLKDHVTVFTRILLSNPVALSSHHVSRYVTLHWFCKQVAIRWFTQHFYVLLWQAGPQLLWAARTRRKFGVVGDPCWDPLLIIKTFYLCSFREYCQTIKKYLGKKIKEVTK